MVKVALQISGRLRFTPQSITSLMGSIIETQNPDIFCSFWDPINPETIKSWNNYINPTLVELEDQTLVRPYLDLLFPFNVHINMPSMCYKFHQVNALRQAYEQAKNIKYDYVIQARSDNLFFEKLPDISTIVKNDTGIWCSNSRRTPEIDRYISPRMVDNFYLGDANSVSIAASTLWHLRHQAEEYTKKDMIHHVRIPEIIQSQIWKNLGITIRNLPGSSHFGDFNYEIDRSDTEYK